jgi:NAD(P)-dependent dehydrogenase (short-subunit alcohol dehydrogenase family)
MRFTGKDIVILGGSSGIGLAVARAALEQGGSVSIASSRQETVAKAYYALTVDYPASKNQGSSV